MSTREELLEATRRGKVIQRGATSTLEKPSAPTRPNEAIIPPMLTPHDAQTSWALAVAGAFKKAGMDQYVQESVVEGGTIRKAVRDEGGLCDYPECKKEYRWILTLDALERKVFESRLLSEKMAATVDGFDGIQEADGSQVPENDFQRRAPTFNGHTSLMVCDDHKDWRPDAPPSSMRYTEGYVWKGKDAPQHFPAKVPTIEKKP